MRPDIKLACRAVACEGWRWLPGMGCVNPALPDAWCARIGDECRPTYNHYLPDFSDPATQGCLLALVREAWGCLNLSVVGTSEGWRIDADGGPVGIRDLHSYPAEAEVLVAALEAADAAA